MRLYVIGPVTGRPDENFEAFGEASDELLGAGYHACIPHEFVAKGAAWPDAMRDSIHALTGDRPAFDGVAILDGWEQSEGARLERMVAEACGIPCKTVDEWLEDAR